MRLDGEQWQAYFRTFQQSAFRLEVHQVYTMPGEADSFRRFLAGEAKPDGFNSDWHARIRANVAAGKTMQRVKIVHRPFTDYTRYLFDWGIPGNVEAGEEYRILDLTDVENPGLPDQDFWFFDDRVVVNMNYRPDGTQISRELLDSPDLAQYRRWKELALSLSTPFAEYAPA